MPRQITREQLAAEYLDYLDNYITVDLFAEHRGLTEDEGRKYLEVCKSAFENKHPEA